ncbi:hypothetical protein Scep_011656 [Stephania cephalantha]|uniref:Peroxin-7 n=1 Tax=Stephania cephalantha TaxID=152367 RepID=A0AAP0P623_9MAGN
MPRFKLPFHGYAVKFSPFYEHRLAVGTSQNFGILGNGRIHILDLAGAGAGAISESLSFDTADGIYDVSWSESNDNLLISATGDGSVKIWDLAAPPTANPSGPSTSTLASVRTFKEHAYCVYAAAWNPRHADVFASASGDCTVRVWDVREPGSTMIIPGHEFEILTCDWNKYNDCVIATGSVDKSIRVWDVRSYRVPISVMNGHGYPVRKVKFSPHHGSFIASCSYDMSVCCWDYQLEDALVSRYEQHTEFAVGLDMSVLVEGLLASAGWDQLVYVWQHGSDPMAGLPPDDGMKRNGCIQQCGMQLLLVLFSISNPLTGSQRSEELLLEFSLLKVVDASGLLACIRV